MINASLLFQKFARYHTDKNGKQGTCILSILYHWENEVIIRHSFFPEKYNLLGINLNFILFLFRKCTKTQSKCKWKTKKWHFTSTSAWFRTRGAHRTAFFIVVHICQTLEVWSERVHVIPCNTIVLSISQLSNSIYVFQGSLERWAILLAIDRILQR